MKAPYIVNRITFTPSEAKPGGTLQVRVLKLSGGHADNFLVQNVSRALVSQLVVKFGSMTLDATVDYDIYKIFTDLFLPEEKRGNMLAEGI